MFETPVDTLFLWVALVGVSVAVLGVVTAVPTTAPPDAAGTAATIDEVTTSPPGSVLRRSSTAETWRLDGRHLALRNAGGSSHATLTRPAVPVHDDQLNRVLDGSDPAEVYRTQAAFERAVSRARTSPTEWHTAPDRFTVRHVIWGAIDVMLVG